MIRILGICTLKGNMTIFGIEKGLETENFRTRENEFIQTY